ncbi:NADPH-dependent FMN reductase [Micromonospora sp. LOL_025]|uniref:NADPH-dependent FMN reductase n=1 Tax=Micromonospora sp. LOL_025 TaxID=3345413 RepID=UPI003A8998FB
MEPTRIGIVVGPTRPGRRGRAVASAAGRNAIDHLCAEWHHKAAGFVGYGVTGGWRAVEALRLVLAEVRVAGVRTAVGLSLPTDLTGERPTPGAHQERSLAAMRRWAEQAAHS